MVDDNSICPALSQEDSRVLRRVLYENFCHVFVLLNPGSLPSCCFFSLKTIFVLTSWPQALRAVWMLRCVIHTFDTRHVHTHTHTNCSEQQTCLHVLWETCIFSRSVSPHSSLSPLWRKIHIAPCSWLGSRSSVVLCPSSLLPVALTTPDQATNYGCWHEPPCNLKSTSLPLRVLLCFLLPSVISFITFYSAFIHPPHPLSPPSFLSSLSV